MSSTQVDWYLSQTWGGFGSGGDSGFGVVLSCDCRLMHMQVLTVHSELSALVPVQSELTCQFRRTVCAVVPSSLELLSSKLQSLLPLKRTLGFIKSRHQAKQRRGKSEARAWGDYTQPCIARKTSTFASLELLPLKVV